MSRGFPEIPTVECPDNVAWTGAFPSFLARTAVERGPIFRLALDDAASSPVFMVGPEANRFVLHTHREYFSHDRGWTPIVGEWLGHGLLNMDPPEHTRHRRMMNPAFTSAYLATYLPIMQRVIAERTSDWIERGEVDLFHEAREIAFDVAAAALVGFHTGAETNRLRELFYALLHGFDATQETWEQYVWRRDRILDELHRLVLPLIATRRAILPDEQPHDVLGTIIHARDEDGSALDDEQVLAHVKILLVAGHETTTTLGAWVLYLLATHPDYLARVEAELRPVIEDPNAPIPFEALRSTRVLDNFVKETGRLYSPVFNVPRGVLADVEFGGYTLAGGEQVRLALAACHRLPDVFADPEVFDPGRFDVPREEDRRTPYALVTFGGGPRVCIGMQFAQIEVKAIVTHVLRRFRFEPVPDQDLRHVGYWTAFLPNGIRVRVARRR